MKTALWLLLAFAVVIAAVLVAGAEESFFSPILLTDDFPRAMLVDAGDPLLNWPSGGAPKPPVKLVGDSLSDIVHDSEHGQMPSREEFNRRGLGAASSPAAEQSRAGNEFTREDVPEPGPALPLQLPERSWRVIRFALHRALDTL